MLNLLSNGQEMVQNLFCHTHKEFWGGRMGWGEGRSNMGIRIPDQLIHSLVTKNVQCLVSFLAFVTILAAHLKTFT